MFERSQFTFYESFYRAISRIKDNSDRAATYDAICAYALYGTMPDLDTLPDASAIAFELIKPNLDASRKKASNGRKGGASKQNASKLEANHKQSGSKPEANTEDAPSKKEKENEIEKEIEKEVEDECLIGHGAANAPISDPVAVVLSDYLNRINPTASPSGLDELRSFAEDLGEAVCKRAFDIALDNKKTTWPYIKAILRDKAARGVKCLADWDALEAERESRKEGGSDAIAGNFSEGQKYGLYL